jgi:membrane-associated phospholipid phosphatase
MNQKFVSWCAEYLIFVEAFIVVIFVLHERSIKDASIQLCTIGLLTIAVWYSGAILKFLFRKERPEKEKKVILRDKYSFPSMHALTAVSASTYVSIQNGYLGLLMFVITFVLMYARVKVNMHYYRDMLAGAVVGSIGTVLISGAIHDYVVIFYTKYLW